MGNDRYRFIRSVFSATLHKPVMLSLTSGCQKYSSHLLSVRLPPAASLGCDILRSVPRGHWELFSQHNILCSVPTSRPWQGVRPGNTAGPVTLCGWPLMPGYFPPAQGIWHKSVPQPGTNSVVWWPQMKGVQLQVRAAIVPYSPSRSPDHQAVMASQFICTEQTLVIALYSIHVSYMH